MGPQILPKEWKDPGLVKNNGWSTRNYVLTCFLFSRTEPQISPHETVFIVKGFVGLIISDKGLWTSVTFHMTFLFGHISY